MEEKERNQVDGCAALYVHSNFLVKGSDGKHTMFFAEMRPDCTQEEDVVLCTPLEENNYGKLVTIYLGGISMIFLYSSHVLIYTYIFSHIKKVIVSGAMIEQRSLGIPRAVATWVDIMR